MTNLCWGRLLSCESHHFSILYMLLERNQVSLRSPGGPSVWAVQQSGGSVGWGVLEFKSLISRILELGKARLKSSALRSVVLGLVSPLWKTGKEGDTTCSNSNSNGDSPTRLHTMEDSSVAKISAYPTYGIAKAALSNSVIMDATLLPCKPSYDQSTISLI
ncbi:hypothetical protein Nepgr_018262 [Nepenthes gracilis]|uniref:Uncharacterized protein n=1 Tax=Nepenthes gracilis TaxID=150966 RepID=A0AAD3STD3_NEPGR|nr:hypothetical protein Nepgr_018262 [Nepenthes gracilis]